MGECVVIDDVDTGKSCVEINGDESYLQFPIQCNLPYLAFQIKNLDRFLRVVLKVRDSHDKTRTLILSNKRTTIEVDHSICQLPVQMGTGWQYWNLDLHDIIRRCFGTTYVIVTDITVHGSTRIGKIYFQDQAYSDAELPPYLRLLAAE